MRIRFGHVAFGFFACSAGVLAGAGSPADRPPAGRLGIGASSQDFSADAPVWKWTMGHQQRWVCTNSRSGKVDGAAKVAWTQQERVVVLQKVTTASPDGSADLEFSIVSARVEIKSDLGAAVLDTTSPDPSTAVDPAGVLRKLVDKKVTCHVDASGHVTAAGGGKALLDELKLAYAKDPRLSAMLGQFATAFDDEALRVRFDRVLGILPTSEQAQGEWTTADAKPCDIELPSLGVLSLLDRHKMEPAGESPPPNLRVIKTTTTATLAKPKAGESPLAGVYVITLDNAKGQGATTIDIAAGQLVGSEASMTYTVKFDPKPGNAPPPAMTQIIEQRVKVERESK
ncbi:MAG: DUF6263 family protein [Planctomycetota bacterium]|mgnify:CR=1 FL=1